MPLQEFAGLPKAERLVSSNTQKGTTGGCAQPLLDRQGTDTDVL